MRNVGDREGRAGGEFRVAAPEVKHGKSAFGLGFETRDGKRYLLGSLPLEEARLTKGWTDPGQVKEHLLEDARGPRRRKASGAPSSLRDR